jgi:hypothetical protein
LKVPRTGGFEEGRWKADTLLLETQLTGAQVTVYHPIRQCLPQKQNLQCK